MPREYLEWMGFPEVGTKERDRLVNKTGSNPKDPRRQDPEKKASRKPPGRRVQAAFCRAGSIR